MQLDWSSPVLGATGRRFATVAVVTSGIGLVVLGARYRNVAGPSRTEGDLAARLGQLLELHRDSLAAFVPAGRPFTVIVAAIVLSALALLLSRPRMALVALVAPPLTGAVAAGLQPAIGRTLEGGFALPSGHTVGATSIAITAALLVTSVAGRYRGPVAVAAGAAVAVVWITISLALVVNDLHFLADTLAGLCTAVVGILGVGLVVDGVVALVRRRELRSGGVSC